ncbi:MAG: hypothetical protein K0B00_02655 [Rhodobacteraceae bacterium]|nr:hypothetical protein [Paracoccaceae bacterium]
MRRTILFCTALAAAVGLFALGAAEAAPPITAASVHAVARASGWISAEALTARLTRGSYRVADLQQVHGLFWRAEIARSDGTSFRVFLAPDGTPLPELSLSPMF